MDMKHFRYNIFIIFILTGVFTACRSHKDLSTQPKPTTENNTSTKSAQQIKKTYASILGVDENKIENVALYSLIDSWYGTSYKYGGSSKNGIDCSNFANIIYQEIYKKSLTGSSASIYNLCKPLSTNDLQEGDLLFFKIEKNTISHIGVYLQNNKFVHATTKAGVRIDDLDQAYYKKYFFKAGRLK